MDLSRTPHRRKGRPNRAEQALQRLVIEWACRVKYQGRPLAQWLYHVPNDGYCNRTEAATWRALGVQPGVPHLVLPIRTTEYGSLYVELRVDERSHSAAQLDYHQRLREGGQRVRSCRTLDEATGAILDYLRLAPGPVARDASTAMRDARSKKPELNCG